MGENIETEPQTNSGAGASELLTVDYQTEVLTSLRDLAMEMRSAGDMHMRAGLRLSMRKVREERVHPFLEYEIRSIPGSGDLTFSGYACVTGDDDASYEMEDWVGPWVESVSRNAFAKTLAEKPDVVFVENHDGRPLCRTTDGRLSLTERTSGAPTGLHVEARLNGERHDVHDVMLAVDDGTYNQMSFAFRVMRQDWNEDYTRRWINEVNLNQGDVSIVSYGANPHTTGTTTARSLDPIRLRSAETIHVNPVALLLAHADFRNWVSKCEWREGKTLSTATMDTLRQVLSMINAADSNIDQALIDLSTPISVDNPDTDAPGAPNDPGSDDDENQLSKLIIPDHARAARARLARLRAA